MATHVQVWSGSRVARVTDMTNAGKRGKVCRVVTFDGQCGRIINRLCTTAEQRAEQEAKGCYALECNIANEIIPDDFDAILSELESLKDERTDRYERTIRGIDAPKPKLTAGIDGVWGGGADETGISLRQYDLNEWSEITHKQTGAAAYAIAVKVWEQVKQAKSCHEAADILRAAGAKLHGYCAVD